VDECKPLVQARRREWEAEWAGEAPVASDREASDNELKQELAADWTSTDRITELQD